MTTTTTTTMTREYLETLESKLNLNFGYFIRCDDTSAPEGVATDMYFHLWETERLIYALELCEEYDLNYDFGFQEWDDESLELDEIVYVSRNHLNH